MKSTKCAETSSSSPSLPKSFKTAAKPAGATALNRNTLAFLGHVFTLLTTAATVNAVTGQLEPDGRISILCTQNEKAHDSASEPVLSEIKKLTTYFASKATRAAPSLTKMSMPLSMPT